MQRNTGKHGLSDGKPNSSASCKQLAKQIRENPKVELAFLNPGTKQGESRMLRVQGTAEILQDSRLEERLAAERPWVSELAKNMPENTELVVFRVSGGQAHFWDMSLNGREAELPRIAIG
ncbi:MAG: pyridoxamine 5'-phosphate oxidase family protein [Pontiellaceae bacterium]|nr:pyridoxamine 5'-phosphate oxidase family protein [Pontiellaceae bacterium]